jgi:very-short-patch-repair endonuclease
MELADAPEVAVEIIHSRLDLLELGYSAKKITKGVRDGTITRLRRDHYVLTSEHDSILTAIRIGGRLTCVSAVAVVSEDVFVLKNDHVHVHAERRSSRLRKADSSEKPGSRKSPKNVRLSWGDLAELPAGRHLVALVDVIRALIRCLPEREAIATLDSMLRLGLVTMMQVREAVAAVPARYRQILDRIDPRAESGPESFMRLILRDIGIAFDVQVKIRGVGRVDFVVDGFLIIECDSKEFHGGWEKQRADRKRDLAAAGQGYFTLRVLAEDLMNHPDRIERAVRGLLAAREASWSAS